jgi:hypothetical protein
MRSGNYTDMSSPAPFAGQHKRKGAEWVRGIVLATLAACGNRQAASILAVETTAEVT